MLSGGAKAAYGYDPLTGQELWRVQYNDFFRRAAAFIPRRYRLLL